MRILRASALLWVVSALKLAGQSVEFGAIGGVVATDPDPFGRGESRRYMVGPSIEVRLLGKKLGIELDAIYRRFGESFSGEFTPPPEFTGPVTTRFNVRSRTNSWEFPLLGKYYFRDRDARLRPFAGAGYVFRMQWRETQSTTYLQGEAAARMNTSSSQTGPDSGFLAAGGVEWRGIGRLSLQPQVRYTRWFNHSPFDRPVNQVDIGLGLRF